MIYPATCDDADDLQRQQALDALLIADSGPDPRFDRIVRLAANRFGVPIARLSFIDSEKVWYKASVGLDTGNRPRERSICDVTIRSGEPLVVPDVHAEPAFADLVKATGGMIPRFYAGAPLILPDKTRVGALCIMDHEPRAGLDEAECEELSDFAAIAVHELQLHQHIIKSTHALERAEAEAGVARQARQRFLAIMSHELRTPLNAISGLGDMMCEERFGPLGHDRYRAFSRTICDAAGRLERLIGRVLTLAAAEEGRLDLQESLVDLVDLVTECTSAAAIEATLQGITVRHRIVPESSPGLFADEVQIIEMIHQLVTNAVMASSEGQSVTVTLQPGEDDGVELLVDDNGPGFPRDQSDWLLDPFTMANDGPTRSQGGMGLGLPLTRKLADLHGARLDFPRQEQGFRARIRFPAERCRSADDLDRARLSC